MEVRGMMRVASVRSVWVLTTWNPVPLRDLFDVVVTASASVGICCCVGR